MIRSDGFINRRLHNLIGSCPVGQQSFHILFLSDCALRESQDSAMNLLFSASSLTIQAYQRDLGNL